MIVNINERKKYFLCKKTLLKYLIMFTQDVYLFYVWKYQSTPSPLRDGGYVFGHIFLSCFIRCIFQLPTIGGITKKRRQYNPQLNAAAYRDVTEKGVSVYKAARMYGIPESTHATELLAYSLLW